MPQIFRGSPKSTLQPLAICSVGLGYCGTVSLSYRELKWLLIRTDYFTKWVKVEPLANIDAKRFIWRNIVTRFGVPQTLISDNGLQFDSKAFHRYCGKLRIKNMYSTPVYPQENGQAKATNKVIVSGLKNRLDDAKGKWVDELPHILWTYRTTP